MQTVVWSKLSKLSGSRLSRLSSGDQRGERETTTSLSWEGLRLTCLRVRGGLRGELRGHQWVLQIQMLDGNNEQLTSSTYQVPGAVLSTSREFTYIL